MLPLQNGSVYSLALSWVIFLLSCKILYLLLTHLLNINWHFFFSTLVCPFQWSTVFIFIHCLSGLFLSPGWPGIPKALSTELAFSALHFPEDTHHLLLARTVQYSWPASPFCIHLRKCTVCPCNDSQPLPGHPTLSLAYSLLLNLSTLSAWY